MKKTAGTQIPRKKKRIALCAILPFILLMSGCFLVEVKQNVKNPDKYFRKAFQKIDRLHSMYPERRGPVSDICILVFEKSEQQLVRVTASMWLVDAGMNYCDTYDIDTDCDFDIHSIEKLRDLGPGLLVEADTEDSKVLIWIE